MCSWRKEFASYWVFYRYMLSTGVEERNLSNVHEVKTRRRVLCHAMNSSWSQAKILWLDLTGRSKLQAQLLITKRFAYNLDEKPLPCSQHVFAVVLALPNKHNRERWADYCSVERGINRFLWIIIGFIHNNLPVFIEIPFKGLRKRHWKLQISGF